MTIWAIADLHLAISVPKKTMEVFGPNWKNYQERIEENWRDLVKEDDLVLLPGDICWAKHLDEALVDLQWIHSLPGTKVMIRGNHDYWWGSYGKLQKALPPSLHAIHHNAFQWGEVSIGGSRLWDTIEYSFDRYIQWNPTSPWKDSSPPQEPRDLEEKKKQDERLFQRELNRLELSLKAMDPNASTRLVMTHYPPIGADLAPSRVSKLLHAYNVQICCFGHLHQLKKDNPPLFGEADGIHYHFVAGDHLAFVPFKVLP